MTVTLRLVAILAADVTRFPKLVRFWHKANIPVHGLDVRY
jgi:hypothetical protein